MGDQSIQLRAPLTPVTAAISKQPLGSLLVQSGVISQSQLRDALQMQKRLNAPLGEILVAEGWVAPRVILDALAAQNGLQIADLDKTPASAQLCRLMPVDFWLRHDVIPWMQSGSVVLVATARPDRFHEVDTALRAVGITAAPALASPEQIDRAISTLFAKTLAHAAETRVENDQSCRNWNFAPRFRGMVAVLALVITIAMFPAAAIIAAFVAAAATLFLFMSLRAIGFVAHVSDRPDRTIPTVAADARLPKVSILVPLYKEREIAEALIRRLSRLTYPKALLEVVLVLEEADDVTRTALAASELPHWMRIIEVPGYNGLTTKPRAMNYALDFCQGEIVGVWDAEDAPVADQIEQVVARFSEAPDDVVCLQGVLDYYNPRTTWRARCFTIEYCSWFRVVLPGIARLGLVVPLGGTTLFVRREALEQLGGWDAHNVTEDADLGVRISRAGYRTEMIDTVTYEEANFRSWPWVKQRSRWLKGFMVTYLVHMRSPRNLLTDLGMRRFLGVQAFFLGTVGQFLLAPVLWSLWLVPFGVSHPLTGLIPPLVLQTCVALFVLAELLNIAIGVTALSSPGRRFLIPWVPTMVLYYPLGVAAAYKALWELAVKPYFWDKTQHGQAAEEPAAV